LRTTVYDISLGSKKPRQVICTSRDRNYMKDIKYIYEDNDILVCHKPSGVATEGARTYNMDVVSAARNYIGRQNREKTSDRKPPYVATVHRLDQPVEGVLILAKTKKAATKLAAQIKDRTTEKYYYALCKGSFSDKKGRLENYLVRKEDGLAAVVTEEESNNINDNVITRSNGETIRIIGGEAKKAILEYEVIAENEETTLVRVKLLTGRFHQIRVQMANVDHPIIGDQKYGTEESRVLTDKIGARDVCLVSYKYIIKHPSTGKKMEFEIKPDNPQIREMLEKSL